MFCHAQSHIGMLVIMRMFLLVLLSGSLMNVNCVWMSFSHHIAFFSFLFFITYHPEVILCS